MKYEDCKKQSVFCSHDDDDCSLLHSKACFTFEFIVMASTFNSDESLSSTEAKTCRHIDTLESESNQTGWQTIKMHELFHSAE